MKKLKVVQKTFLCTFLLLLVLTLSIHLLIYFFYPKVYLNRAQHNLGSRLEQLQEQLLAVGKEDVGDLFSDFATENNINLTVDYDGTQTSYLGMNFQISLFAEEDSVFNISNIGNIESIIVKNQTMSAKDGTIIQVNAMASAQPVKEALDMITFLLPFTFGATILFSIVFSYFYSRYVTRPIIELLDKTRKMEEEKTVFLRSASHELKTPLAGLRILLENMQYNIGRYKDRDTYLAQAVKMVDELNGMVKDILDTSKLQEISTGEKQSFFADEELKAVLKEYELQITDKGLVLVTNFDTGISVTMERDAFKRVWSNLIANAIRYTKRGGTISVGADCGKLWIENSCTPMSGEELKYAFEPFYRADSTRNISGGSGLGLYVVSELLKKAGYAFEFVPVSGGMCFRMFLL